MAASSGVNREKVQRAIGSRALAARMFAVTVALLVAVWGVLISAYGVESPLSYGSKVMPRGQPPPQAQVIDQKAFNVLPTVPPPSVANASTVCSYSFCC
jgi:hypothetical protein